MQPVVAMLAAHKQEFSPVHEVVMAAKTSLRNYVNQLEARAMEGVVNDPKIEATSNQEIIDRMVEGAKKSIGVYVEKLEARVRDVVSTKEEEPEEK